MLAHMLWLLTCGQLSRTSLPARSVVPLTVVAKPARLTAKQIFLKCLHAYDSVKTLRESVRASTNSFPSSAEIVFKRPGHLKVTGMSMFRSPYALVCEGTKAWSQINGNWSRMENPEMGIATITGVSGTAGAVVPALLFHTAWAGLTGFEGRSVKVSTAVVSGRRTYRLTADVPKASLWIDAGTFFLVRSEQQVAKSVVIVDFGRPKVNGPVSMTSFSHG